MNQDEIRAITLATQFHELYESLAPSFGYETRQDTRQFDPESKNGRLMVAVCGAMYTRFLAAIAEKAEPVAWVSEKSFAKMRGDYPPMSMYFRNTRYNEMNIPLYTHPAIEPAPQQQPGHYKDQLIDELDNRAAPLPPCILCANGNDLPEGEYCRGCGRSNESNLKRAVRLARGSSEPPTMKVGFAAPLPDEVAQMVEALRRYEWVPVIQQAAEMIERLARERDQAVIRRDEIAHSLRREEVERLARQVPEGCVVVQRTVTEDAKCVMATPGNYRTYQDQWTALIAAGEVK